jgi:hypothetical protein
MDEPWANTDSQDSPLPELEGNHHLPPYSILYAWPRGQHPNVILSWESQMGVPKFPKLGLAQLWEPITLCADLRLKWGLTKSYSTCRYLFNGMWHTTCTQINWGDSWFLVAKNQIGNLILNLSFGHNLCFKCPNGSCELILDIYVPRTFQWYKEFFNLVNFDLCNYLLKIRESIETPIPKVGTHLGVWGFIPSHFFAFPRAWNVTLGLTLGLHLYKPLLWSWAQG